MRREFPKPLIAVLVIAATSLLTAHGVLAQVALDDEFAKEPSWKAPPAMEVRTSIIAWIGERKPDEALRKQIDALWPPATNDSTASPPHKQRPPTPFPPNCWSAWSPPSH